jgi:hypothetical protein
MRFRIYRKPAPLVSRLSLIEEALPSPDNIAPISRNEQVTQDRRSSHDMIDFDLEPPPRIIDPATSSPRSSFVSNSDPARYYSSSSRAVNGPPQRPRTNSPATSDSSRTPLLDANDTSNGLSASSETRLLDGDDPSENSNPKSELWTSRSLHPALFVVLALIFAFVIYVLELLSSLSKKTNGLGNTTSGTRYIISIVPAACK